MSIQAMHGIPRKQNSVTGVLRYVDHTGGKTYTGEYTVTPALTEQTLPTAGAVLKENVQIKEIPIETVSNTAGGNTVIIG